MTLAELQDMEYGSFRTVTAQHRLTIIVGRTFVGVYFWVCISGTGVLTREYATGQALFDHRRIGDRVQ